MNCMERHSIKFFVVVSALVETISDIHQGADLFIFNSFVIWSDPIVMCCYAGLALGHPANLGIKAPAFIFFV